MNEIIKGTPLTKPILEAYEKGDFVSVIIVGPQGAGKTTLALHIAKEVYGNWDEVLKHFEYNIYNVVNLLLDYVDREERAKLLVLDDVGVGLSKYDWHSQFGRSFSKFFEIIRSRCAAVIFTTVEDLDFFKFIRTKVMYKVVVYKELGGRRLPDNFRYAEIYKYHDDPEVRRRYPPKRIARYLFPLKLPEKVRAVHNERRKFMERITLLTIKNPKLAVEELIKRRLYSENTKDRFFVIDDIASEAALFGISRAVVTEVIKAYIEEGLLRESEEVRVKGSPLLMPAELSEFDYLSAIV